MQALLPPAPPPTGTPAGQVRALAVLAAGSVSAFALLWMLRGLPLGGLLMWLSPLPLYAAALAFGTLSAAIAAAVASLPLLALGDLAAVLAFVLVVALPVLLTSWLALSVPAGSPPQLGLPVVALALLAALLLVAAALIMAGHQGGLEGALHATFLRAFAELASPADAAITQFAELLVRVVPLAIGLWYLVAMALNAALAQLLANRFGLLAQPPVLFGALSLPRWYVWPPILASLAAVLLPAGPRFAATGAAEILLLPFFLLGLTLVHVLARSTASPRGWLVAFYIALLIFSAPVLFAVTGAGFADHFGNLRGRIAARANSRPPAANRPPPEDRNGD
ncbi:MAG: DUF2232 domain-containing protein [Acetobacteraceae bacterium]|nr:DUF2232 domain-containing protein [Acetobacteraceae bacterium]